MFALDANAAKAADVKSATIQTAGKYVGKIICAEYIENAAKGSKNIRIAFKSDNGQEASFFLNMVYQGNQKNETNHKVLSAILACIRCRNTGEPAPGFVEKWNKETQKREQTPAMVFPDLAGKRIGFLVQMEIGKTSESGYPNPTIYLPFEAETEKTASEVLANPPVMRGEVLPKAVQHIAAHPLVDRRPKGASGAGLPAYESSGAPAADFDDDIPF